MADAEQTGRTEEQTNQARNGLNTIWSEWDVRAGADKANQYAALEAVMSRLDKVEDNPAELVRGVQVLLCDPQAPGIHKRPCWKPIQSTLRDVSVDSKDVQMVQALLLAAWPTKPETKRVPQLLRQAWEVQRGRAVQRPTLERWLQEMSEPSPSESQPLNAGYWPVQDPLAPVGKPRVQDPLVAVKGLTEEINRTRADNMDLIDSAIMTVTVQQDLLWWGQARYSTRLQKPYRRLEHREDAVFWAALEAAERVSTADVEVEPAAAYLVEVLHALGLDVEEQKPLRTWMEVLSTTLTREPKAPSVEGPLVALAEEDALGLPVTWARLRAREKDGLAQAAEKVGLALDETIDRGAWATWIFREVLLERLLAEGSAP